MEGMGQFRDGTFTGHGINFVLSRAIGIEPQTDGPHGITFFTLRVGGSVGSLTLSLGVIKELTILPCLVILVRVLEISLEGAGRLALKPERGE